MIKLLFLESTIDIKFNRGLITNMRRNSANKNCYLKNRATKENRTPILGVSVCNNVRLG